jgi:hypothetical protein
VSEPRFERAHDVVWRTAHDRVIVRRPGARIDGAAEGAVDLFGDAALIWTALDTAGDLRTLRRRLRDADVEPADVDLVDTIGMMVATGWLVQVST